MRQRLLIVFLVVCVAAPFSWAQEPETLSTMSVEDLLNVEVTSVSKTEQKLSRTASVIFVISQEDIQRSGATNIPDVLRMVPGVDVAQISSNTWAISARGFSGRFSNKLLVMVDGRTVYTPTFGGVFWDQLDFPLEDVERIEVIRGPGGSVWGANAVNGVINIITRRAEQTKGAMLVAGAGNLASGLGTLRYGGALGGSTSFRVYSKYFSQNQLPGADGPDAHDGWHVLRGGFRTDSNISTRDSLMVQGDVYTGREGEVEPFAPSITAPGIVQIPFGVNLSGGFLQAAWKHTDSARSDTALQISYDRYEFDDVLGETRDTADVDFTHHLALGRREDLLWGLGYRYSTSVTAGTLAFSLAPPNMSASLFSSFIEDEIALNRDTLYLTLGTKLEHNYYTGFRAMPSIRAAWLLNARQTVWAAVSRPLRTPAETDAASRIFFGGFVGSGGTPVEIGLVGNPKFQDERSLTYELGYRASLNDHLSIDLAAYYDDADSQQTSDAGAPFVETTPSPTHLVIPVTYQNLMQGEAHGFEAFAKWKVSSLLELSPGYAFEQVHMHLKPGSQDRSSMAQAQGSSPVNSAQLRSHLTLSRSIAWDTSVYFVGRIADPTVRSYTRLDTGLSWQAGERLSFSAFGQNLLKQRHLEYVDTTQSVASSLMKRGVYGKVRWAF